MAEAEIGGHVASVDVLHQGVLTPFLEAENLVIIRQNQQ